MALINYHYHMIVSIPIYDDDSGKWKCVASISWPDESGERTRQLHFINDCHEPFSRYEDAENAGLEAAKDWVESRAAKPLRANLTTRSLSGYRRRG